MRRLDPGQKVTTEVQTGQSKKGREQIRQELVDGPSVFISHSTVKDANSAIVTEAVPKAV